MHILIVNDDGPPSNQSSPYVHSLVKTLQEAGHVISVCLPHTQRSWIGKAHMIGQTVKPTYFRPGTLHEDDGTTHSRPSPAGSLEEWVLVDGTPASCVQIGLYHFFKDRGPIDLVVSGPNYGRNSTAVFGLSSGTLGGALEAAVCKKKAIAISYAFNSRVHDPVHIAGASRQSVKLIEYLYKNWSPDADLYTVNVPLVDDVENRKIMWTNMLQNYWGPTSCFEEEDDPSDDADEAEQRIRQQEGVQSDTSIPTATSHQHKHFRWAPRFLDVHKSVEDAPPGNDGWAVKEGYSSVTPLRANFMHAAAGSEGELKLSTTSSDLQKLSLTPNKHQFCAEVDYGDDYVQPLILSALKARLPDESFTIRTPHSQPFKPEEPTLQIKQYEEISFETLMSNSTSFLANSYIIRKALIRKHYLSTTAHNWITKNPSSILATNMKPSCEFELDYAEFLDDALVEAWELQESFRENDYKIPAEREWWILKPGMSDRGQGIRLFSTQEELQDIFEEWEADLPDSDDDEADVEGEDNNSTNKEPGGDYIMTSQLRHFVAQPYISRPLLLPDNPRKFHIRTYVVCVGALKVYVYKPMLALFATEPYSAPYSSTDSNLRAHLTNTCLQDGTRDGSVQLFWSLPNDTTSATTTTTTTTSLSSDWKETVFKQICTVTSDIFEAAARGMTIHFQTLPNAFEVFGLDFLVDEMGTAWLLEVNAFPDFKQTGDELGGLVGGLWEGVVDVAVKPFFGIGGDVGEGDGQMVLVKEMDLGRR